MVYKEIYQCSDRTQNYLEVSEYNIGDARLRPAHSSKRIFTKIYEFCQERGYESVEVMNMEWNQLTSWFLAFEKF